MSNPFTNASVLSTTSANASSPVTIGTETPSTAASVARPKKGTSKKRKTVSIPARAPLEKKKKRGSRVNKGLRHFSIKVCEKLSQTGETTYNEIAELLVAESRPGPGEPLDPSGKGYDEKNIRRRIYDALNVLMAMDIIQKDKKKIRWRGIRFGKEGESVDEKGKEGGMEQRIAGVLNPITPNLKSHKQSTNERIQKKRKLLEEMTYEFIARKALIERNRRPEALLRHKDKLYRPFIIINTNPGTDVTCEMGEDRTHVHFSYSDAFCIHDNHVILKEYGMQLSAELVPHELRPFLPSRFPGYAAPVTGIKMQIEKMDESIGKRPGFLPSLTAAVQTSSTNMEESKDPSLSHSSSSSSSSTSSSSSSSSLSPSPSSFPSSSSLKGTSPAFGSHTTGDLPNHCGCPPLPVASAPSAISHQSTGAPASIVLEGSPVKEQSH